VAKWEVVHRTARHAAQPVVDAGEVEKVGTGQSPDLLACTDDFCAYSAYVFFPGVESSGDVADFADAQALAWHVQFSVELEEFLSGGYLVVVGGHEVFALVVLSVSPVQASVHSLQVETVGGHMVFPH